MSPSFVPPVANDNSPIYRERDRYRPVPALGQRLMSHFGGQPRGRSVLKIAGVYGTYDYPTQAQIDSATEVYLGGHLYPITSAQATALQAAGYTTLAEEYVVGGTITGTPTAYTGITGVPGPTTWGALDNDVTWGELLLRQWGTFETSG